MTGTLVVFARACGDLWGLSPIFSNVFSRLAASSGAVNPSIETLQHLPELPLVRAEVQLRSARGGRGVSRAGVVRPYPSYRPGWTSFSRLGWRSSRMRSTPADAKSASLSATLTNHEQRGPCPHTVTRILCV
jgi:hypothetical protein